MTESKDTASSVSSKEETFKAQIIKAEKSVRNGAIAGIISAIYLGLPSQVVTTRTNYTQDTPITQTEIIYNWTGGNLVIAILIFCIMLLLSN